MSKVIKYTTDQIEELVMKLYTDFNLDFPEENPIDAITGKMGAEFEVGAQYRIGDIAGVRKRGDKMSLVVCMNEHMYRIDNYHKVEADWLIYRTLGQAITVMGWWATPELWASIPDGLHLYKDIRFQKQLDTIEYFASAMLIPKTYFMNAKLLNTDAGGYNVKIDVWKMADDLGTTMPMVLERAKQLNVRL